MNATEKAAKAVVREAAKTLRASRPGKYLVELLAGVVAEVPSLTPDEISALAVIVLYGTSPYSEHVSAALNK